MSWGGGKPCIRGLRVRAGTEVGLLASGESRGRIFQAYPYLEPADLDEGLAYAAWRSSGRDEGSVRDLRTVRAGDREGSPSSLHGSRHDATKGEAHEFR